MLGGWSARRALEGSPHALPNTGNVVANCRVINILLYLDTLYQKGIKTKERVLYQVVGYHDKILRFA